MSTLPDVSPKPLRCQVFRRWTPDGTAPALPTRRDPSAGAT